MNMNESACRLADEIERNTEKLRVSVSRAGKVRTIDCGCAAQGGLAAGLAMARVCTAHLAEIALVPGTIDGIGGTDVQIATDDPIRACLASQYAGWQVKEGGYFAMGSGPMRALTATEEIFQHIPGKEDSTRAVGVLEAGKLPSEAAVAKILNVLPSEVEMLSFLVAPAASMAGTLQVVARSVETALHKLHELKFDVNRVVSAYGVAPLPPVAATELAAIGRTNDAILYGGRVILWVRAEDDELAAIGPRVPSCSSADHGTLFDELYLRYGNFYGIDPLLFSPAEVEFRNLSTGRCHRFGRVDAGLLRKSFAS